jgi:ADP-heptose:LPS heptosyltransferase
MAYTSRCGLGPDGMFSFRGLRGEGSLKGTFLSAGHRAVRMIDRRTRWITSPKGTRALAGPLLYGDVKTRTSDILVQDARSILVVRLDGIGDLVLMSPFLRELRRLNPNAWITLVVGPPLVNLVELCPLVSEVLTFEPHQRFGKLVRHIRALRLAGAHLWQRQFDLALLPRWDVDHYHSAFVAYLSGAVCRVGYSENVTPWKQQYDRGLDILFTRTLDDRTSKHEAERNLDLLRKVGGTVMDDRLELWLGDEDRETARAALTARGVTGNDLLVSIAPGASHPTRLWPVRRFIDLGRFLQQEFGARLLIIGGPEDRERARELQENLGNAAVSFAGEMTLRQTGALLEHVPLVVANDSGPMHLAAAAGAAVVEISCHPTSGDPLHRNSPIRFHPWANKYIVLQPPQAAEPCTSSCEWHEAHCILGISVEAVREAAQTLLAPRPGSAQAGSAAPA